MANKLQLYTHQNETVTFLKANARAYIASTAGCGKSACIVRDVESRLYANMDSKTLILAPKSLLHTVWENEFRLWAPHISTSVATAPAKKRKEAFEKYANVYITNIDALTWLAKQPVSFWENYETVIIDESTTIANDSARTRAAMKIKKHFKYRRCMSGTPTSGLLTQLFFQYLFLDDGASLGTSFYKFRNQALIAKQTGPHPKMVTWSNKPGREKIIAHILKPITIRYILDEVIDMPPTVKYTYTYTPNYNSQRAYGEMKKSARLLLSSGEINAINAAAMTTKLRQIAAGFAYDTASGDSHLIDLQRYELVLDVATQYTHAVVFFNWKAQREFFIDECKKRKIKATFIDGTVSAKDRKDRVNDFQKGLYDIIFLQPQSSAHGITLTAAHVTIWSSPTYLSDYYSQGNNRVYRAGQTKRTTIINIEAEGTLDHVVYEKLDGKLDAMSLLTEAL